MSDDFTCDGCGEYVGSRIADRIADIAARVAELEALAFRLTTERNRAEEWRDHDKARAERAEAALTTALDDALEKAAIAVFGAVTQDPKKTSEEVLLHASRIIRSMKGRWA